MRTLKFSFLAIVVLFQFISCGNKSTQNQEKKQDSTQEKLELPTTASFSYTPITPKEGKLKGVVELGATGFNLFIIEIDKDDNWVLRKKEYGTSLITENMTSAKEVKSTLKNYIKTILEFGVKGKNIHFVVSSGAAKENITLKITKALKEIGYFVNVVTPAQEAKYALKCVLPKDYNNKAFVVDLGSGNTKISYFNNKQLEAIETFGAKYYKKDIDDKKVYEDVKSKVENIPNKQKTTCFLIGGVPYKMAKSLRKDKERFTVLSTDMTTYNALLTKEGKKMSCGLNIYKGILDGTNCEQVVFDWDANFTIGFLLSLKY